VLTYEQLKIFKTNAKASGQCTKRRIPEVLHGFETLHEGGSCGLTCSYLRDSTLGIQKAKKPPGRPDGFRMEEVVTNQLHLRLIMHESDETSFDRQALQADLRLPS
jgi:hypothetical protein